MIEQIKQALEKATPGPWKDAPEKVNDPDEHYRKIRAGNGYHTSPFTEDTGFSVTGFISPENARIMSQSPEWLRYLIGEVERLKEEAKRYKWEDEQFSWLQEQVSICAKENEELCKALEWYADETNHELVETQIDEYSTETTSAVWQDSGERARKALGREV